MEQNNSKKPPVERNFIFPSFINENFIDNIFKELNDTIYNKNKVIPNYPPIDIYEKENKFFIEIVAAGFSKEEIKIEIENKKLVVKAERQIIDNQENDVKISLNYNLKSISRKNFERAFTFMNNIENVNASFINGILVLEIIFEQNNKNVKTIDIN